MPQFGFPLSRRYNSLRLLGHEYNSIWQLCAISLVTDLRRPVFADVKLAKRVLKCLLSDETQEYLHLRAFTLMPNHLHLIAGVYDPNKQLTNLIGGFKSYTTQEYWKRCREIIDSNTVARPSACILKRGEKQDDQLILSLLDWRANLRPQVMELKNWPEVNPGHFLRKRLWQTRMFDHIIRNDFDLEENLRYIAMNPVHEGYVTVPQFYPFTAFL